jgi:hypothetical protein
VPGVGLQPRPSRAWFVTDKGASVVSHPCVGSPDDDHIERAIATDDDGTIYVTVTSDDGITTTAAYHQYDDGGSFPRAVGHRDAGTTSRVVPRGGVRGGRRMVLEWSRLSRLAGNLGGQLVRKRGHV